MPDGEGIKMQRIKKGDTVQVVSGIDFGVRGQVEEVLNDWYIDRHDRRVRRNPDGDRVRVEGVNVRKKHKKRTQSKGGEIVEIRAPIHISNVMLVCPSCQEATRVGFHVEDDRKTRVCKRCGSSIDKTS